MKLSRNLLSSAVHKALVLGVFSTMTVSGMAVAQDAGAQDAGTQDQSKVTELQSVIVTGSHIRRVDRETSNPIIKIDRQAIEASGDVTLGDLIQDLPAVTGPVTNPNINNGGGTGATSVGLRGLGAARTLVLVNGQRVLNDDLNAVPAAAVDHIEVLTTGASSVYGSDAIGGAINIILKKDFQGAQLQVNYGLSGHSDGRRNGYSFTAGQTTEKGSILVGVGYNKTDAIMESARRFSAHTLSITGSTNTPVHSFSGGSTFAPRGRFQVPDSLQGQFGCSFVSLNPDAFTGNTAPTTLNDYHCYDPAQDGYSFADSRPITTPQERTNLFVNGEYHVTDNVDAYVTAYHNKTRSGFLLGPVVWATGSGPVVSKDNMYNPFGVDYTLTSGYDFRSRLTTAPNRFTDISTANDQGMIGLRGNFNLFDRDWDWDIGYDYGHTSRQDTITGLPNTDFLLAGLGPSMLVDGQPACVSTPGDPTTAIAGCTPWDTFNLQNPTSLATVNDPDETHPAMIHSLTVERIKHASLSGGLFDLPYGTVQLAVGLDWRSEYSRSEVDPALLSDLNGQCQFGSQCASPLRGGYSVHEAYAEVFIPVLGDLPGVQEFNIDLGFRHSDFSNFGSTNNSKIALEYRPTSNLLLRGTVAEVFRAPTIGNIYGQPRKFGSRLNSDPCDHLTAANPACPNVPTDGSFVNDTVASHVQGDVLTSGSAYAGFDLGPEEGKSFDIGAVYSPDFAPGLSVSVDTWKIYLNDVITGMSNQVVVNACFAGLSRFCPLIHRLGADSASPGQIQNILLPTANLGRLDVRGTDMEASYRMPTTAWGDFAFRLQATYMQRDDLQTAPGVAGNQTIHGAGTYNLDAGVLGFVPRWRSQGSVSWHLGNWNASWRLNYVGRWQLGSHQPERGFSAVPGFKDPYVLKYGARTVSDLQVGYDVKAIHTRFDLGINNVFDKQPPILYETNIGSGNANTSPSNFDPIGRYYWVRGTVTF